MPKRIEEKSTLSKRTTRYARVAQTLAGVGVRVAGKKAIGKPFDDVEKAALLRAALGGLKGPLMKVAQILGTIPDLVPKEYADLFATLQANAPSMGESFVRRRMNSELGAQWEKEFKKFDTKASYAASLGQVHKAIAKDGTTLACKLQYPDMESIVEADLKQLNLALMIYEKIDKALDTKEVHEEIADRLHEELDYFREAHSMKLYRSMLNDLKDVHIPKPIDNLTTKRLLSMTWLEGENFLQAIEDRNQTERNTIARTMFRAWYTSFYQYAIIHGDPHFGNYTIRPDNTINLLDFGCMRIFEPELVQGIMLIYESLAQNKPDLAPEAYQLWGFKNPSKALIEILNQWAKFLYAPLLEDKTRAISETNTGAYGKETARKIHESLRKLGRVTVPRAFVFMDRAAVGMGSVFLRLDAKVNWHQEFHALIDCFDVETLRQRQKEILKKDF